MNTRWYKNAIVYQIYPLSFKDSNNDGYGDINGIISKLDYIKNLGVTAIWVSPLYVSPFKDYGYDIADYYNIDKRFGTLKDFTNLISECHARGLKVIMDMVLNHTSSEHEWFKKALAGDSKYRNYYIIKKGVIKNGVLNPPNNYQSSFSGSSWQRIGNTDEYYFRIFTKDQPDLNWDNKEVREEASKILNFWMDLGVDGFRFDVFNLYSKVDGMPDDKRLLAIPRGSKYFVDGPHMHEYLHELYNNSLKNYDSFTVGESYMPSDIDSYNYVKEKNEELNTIFDFSIFKSDSFLGLNILKKKFSILKFKDGLFKPQSKYFNGGWNTLVLENHDNARSINRFGLDNTHYHYEVSTMLPTITFLGFGTPFIYQGEECGIENPTIKSLKDCKDPVSELNYNMMKKLLFPKKLRDNCLKYGARDNARCPLSWNDKINAGFNDGAKCWMNINDHYLTNNIEKDLNSEKSIYKYYQKLLKIKKNIKAFIYGDVTELNHFDLNTVSYKREFEGETYLVISSFKNKVVKYKLPDNLIGKKIELLLSNYDSVIHKKGLVLKPYQAVVLKVK